MAYQIHWLVPKRVITLTLSGGVMADEVQDVADQLYDTISAINSPHLIHMIVDAHEASIQDRIWNYGRTQLKRHPSNGWTVVVGDSRLIGLVMAILSKVLNTHLHYSPTADEALAMLIERDSTLAPYLEEHREAAATAATR